MVEYNKAGLQTVFRPGKRRTLIILFSVASLVLLITLISLAATGTFRKDSPASAESSGSNVGGEGDPESFTISPTVGPAADLTKSPTATAGPTQSPTASPTKDPLSSVTYRPGLLTVQENGLVLSQGLSSRIIARSGQPVPYSGGGTSDAAFHLRPDFGATFPVPSDATENQGGWVYVSNSEMEAGGGGVGAITFDKDGNVIHYQMILTNTTMNCAGGRTPWDTWVSCEEVPYVGQIYQVDPFGRRPAERLTMGLLGGRYESFTFDDRNRDAPRYYVTEDQPNGPTRRWTPDSSSINWDSPWDMLHGTGTLEYLSLTPDADNATGIYEWISSVDLGRQNAEIYYPSTEGIDRKDNILYIVCKAIKFLYIIDLDGNTYKRYSTEYGLFDGEPDQVKRIVNGTDDIMYFSEDGGTPAGVHGRNSLGQFFTIMEGPGWSIETTGLAFDPSGKHMYVAFQDSGVLFDITRDDGLPFQGLTLDVQYHNSGVNPAFLRR